MGNITSLNEQEKNTDKSRKEFFFFAGSISHSRREPALLAIGLLAFESTHAESETHQDSIQERELRQTFAFERRA